MQAYCSCSGGSLVWPGRLRPRHCGRRGPRRDRNAIRRASRAASNEAPPASGNGRGPSCRPVHPRIWGRSSIPAGACGTHPSPSFPVDDRHRCSWEPTAHHSRARRSCRTGRTRLSGAAAGSATAQEAWGPHWSPLVLQQYTVLLRCLGRPARATRHSVPRQHAVLAHVREDVGRERPGPRPLYAVGPQFEVSDMRRQRNKRRRIHGNRYGHLRHIRGKCPGTADTQ